MYVASSPQYVRIVVSRYFEHNVVTCLKVTACILCWMTEEVFFIFVKVVEPPSLLSSVFGALSMFGVVVEVVVLVKLYADETL